MKTIQRWRKGFYAFFRYLVCVSYHQDDVPSMFLPFLFIAGGFVSLILMIVSHKMSPLIISTISFLSSGFIAIYYLYVRPFFTRKDWKPVWALYFMSIEDVMLLIGDPEYEQVVRVRILMEQGNNS